MLRDIEQCGAAANGTQRDQKGKLDYFGHVMRNRKYMLTLTMHGKINGRRALEEDAYHGLKI